MNLDSLSLWVALPASILIAFSGVLALIGSSGLLRFAHFYQRLHAPTLASTLGTLCLVLASTVLSSVGAGRPVLHALLITLFLVIGTPITTMLLMRAAIRREVHSG
jgi:multicomponent K+:H+ antiporter subunit G